MHYMRLKSTAIHHIALQDQAHDRLADESAGSLSMHQELLWQHFFLVFVAHPYPNPFNIFHMGKARFATGGDALDAAFRGCCHSQAKSDVCAIR